MRFFRKLGLALAALAVPAAAQAPSELRPKLPLGPTKQVSAPATVPTVNASPASLTKADVDAWLDGFMPYAMASGDLPGAVVVVVKDGHVLTERGFGFADRKARKPVDPARTLFRPGSISKLFTWTAVMQQVQAGKIDLDADVNTYLDFKIPPAFGKPITMRNLMTHTAGFEETVKYLITANPKLLKPLDQVLKRWVPDRIYAPGAMPAYSNYGASLAGYIVERVSGEKFEDYIQRHIMAPLGMNHSSFAQPLPANQPRHARTAATTREPAVPAPGQARCYINCLASSQAVASIADCKARAVLVGSAWKDWRLRKLSLSSARTRTASSSVFSMHP